MRSSGASSTHPLEALKREGPSAPRASLHSLVAGAGNDIELLLARQVDELHGIAGDADGEVRVLGLFGVLHRVDELLCTEDIDVEMVSALSEVAVHHVDEIVRAFVKRVAERIGADRLGVGNAVKRILVGELRHGIERGEQTALLSAVAWVGARR